MSDVQQAVSTETRTKVVIARKWSNPQIEAFVSADDVGSSLALSDFLDAVVVEMSSPDLGVSKVVLRDMLQVASDAILYEMRHATRYVV